MLKYIIYILIFINFAYSNNINQCKNPTPIETRYFFGLDEEYLKEIFGFDISQLTIFGFDVSASKCSVDVDITIPIIGKKVVKIPLNNCTRDINSTYQDAYLIKLYGNGSGNKYKQSGEIGVSFLKNDNTILGAKIKGIHENNSTKDKDNQSASISSNLIKNDNNFLGMKIKGSYENDNNDPITFFTGYAPKGTEKMRFYMHGDLHFGKIDIYKCDNRSYVQFQKDNYSIKEDVTNPMPPTKLVHPVVEVLNAPLPYDVTVHYKTIDNSAKAWEDYIPKEGNVTIKSGQTSIPLNIEIINDNEAELDESFYVQLSNPQPSLVHLNEHNRTKITILADDDAPVCFEDNFEDYKVNDYQDLLSHNWRVLNNKSSNEYIPKIVKVGNDKRLRLTDGSRNLSTVITKDYEFSTQKNLIIVEFDYYAYGGCGKKHEGLGKYGADGIVNVLFDSKVGKSPKPGGLGGSLGYAQNTARAKGQEGFEGGWIGLGIDEYGNFGNCSEGREGGLKGTSCDYNRRFNPQEHANTAVIRGSGKGKKGYRFLKGVEFKKLNLPPVAKKEADDYFSGRYKLIIDARNKNHLYMSLSRKDNNSSKPVTIIDRFDAKDPKYKQGKTPDLVRYAISAGTGGGCNIHEISWIRLKGNCRKYEISDNYPSGPFLAVDTFRWDENKLKDSFDKAISTKIVNKNFDLIIASMSNDGVTSEIKSGIDAAYGLYDGKKLIPSDSDNNILYKFEAWNKAYITKTFNVSKSYKKLNVRLFYCGNYSSKNNITTILPLYKCMDKDKSEIPYYNAKPEGTEGKHLFYRDSDPFAVRPASFKIDIKNKNLIAGEDFNVTFKALDNNGTIIKNFNEQSGDSFTVDATESNAANCKVGKFSPDLKGWKFKKGFKNFKTKYNEVGKILLSINDSSLQCSKRFAKVDCNDKDIPKHWNAQIDTSIKTDKVDNITFKPHHFNIEAKFYNFNKDKNFTYLSNNLDMSSTLDLNISAVTKDNNITQNYNSLCYAKTTELNLDLNYPNRVPTSNELNKIKASFINKLVSINKESNNINKLLFTNIPKELFSPSDKGKTNIKIKINYNRQYNKPINPFDLQISKIKFKDTDNIEGNKTLNSIVRYYYSKVVTTKKFYDDVIEDNVTIPMIVKVYCSLDTLKCAQYGIDINNLDSNDINWWINNNHKNNDGIVDVTTSDINKAYVVTTNNIFINGINRAYKVVKKPNSKPPFIISVIPTNNFINNYSWLLYNEYQNKPPKYLCRIRFINTQDTWSGVGNSGFTINVNKAKGEKTHKIDW